MSTIYNLMKDLFKKPSLYQASDKPFWNDPHISQQMLKAHLDPDFEGASRKAPFIEASANWIKNTLPPVAYPFLLDIGCGPGIYAEKFVKFGYQVTGVDFSERSINYARESSKKANLSIDYVFDNYLDLALNKQFDLITMIYCDYGALSTKDRQKLLKKVSLHLKPKGKFLLDVFSVKKFNDFEEQQTWEKYKNGGFWCGESHIAINHFGQFAPNITLERTLLISDNEITNYYLWTTYFTKEALIKEVTDAGFAISGIFADVKGNSYGEDKPTIAILLEKSISPSTHQSYFS